VIHLLLAKPGTGKTHWLSSHDIVIDCTNTPHRAALVAVCERLALRYDNRATIDELLQVLLVTEPATLAFDNVDRTSPKFLFSLLSLSQVHSLYITATSKARIQVLIDRQSAILVDPPKIPADKLAQIVKEKYPALTSAQVMKITSVASTPAAAVNLANAIASGEMKNLPVAPSKSILPILAIVAVTIMLFIRYEYELTPAMYALLGALGYYARRLLWRAA
jgi:hypothetical protein